jgi:hypothetical protein
LATGVISLSTLSGGILFFRKMESRFADVI